MASTSAFTGLPNLGPKSAQALLRAGITSLAQLRRLGSVGAYVKTKQAGVQVSLNLLWALEGALTDTDWRIVARDERTRLLWALDELQRPPRKIAHQSSPVKADHRKGNHGV